MPRIEHAAYYNENEQYCAQWLRNLSGAGAIVPGHVDARSILDVDPADLAGYTQCHFFAGLGGWSYALRLAGWDDAEPCWTGSCPCQPLSSAGAQRADVDERHLWPAFYRLIAECRPPTIFGEQVASKLGREWFAGIRADLEQLEYAVGCADIPAAGVGAPHIRQRLFWVAESAITGWREEPWRAAGENRWTPPEPGRLCSISRSAGRSSDPRRLGDASGTRLPAPEREGLFGPGWGEEGRAAAESDVSSAPGRLGDADGGGRQVERQPEYAGEQGACGVQPDGPSPTGFWDRALWLPCADGKARRVEPGIQPLAHGIFARVGKLRAAGNAIVPQAAAVFVRAFMETQSAKVRNAAD